MKRTQKIYIDYPNIINSSNGTKCIKELINDIEKHNIKIFKIRRADSYINKFKNRFLNKISNYDNFLKKNSISYGDWFIACDTTSKGLLNYARSKKAKILWWQLAPYNFLGNKETPRKGEFNLPFSSYADPRSNYHFYYQPKIDEDWEYALNYMKRRKRKKHKKICLYTGKGRLTKLSSELKELFCEYEAIFITRLHPSSRIDYFKTLINSDGLISFDEMTQTNLEAASLGLPVFIANPIFPNSSLENFSIQELKSRMTNSDNVFISMVKSKKFPLKPFDKKYLQMKNNKTIEKFINILKNNLKLKKVNLNDIKRIKQYSSFLLSKKAIYPFINSGQAPSSILIHFYKVNLSNSKKYRYVNLISKILDYFGYVLYKLGLIRIIEVLVFKILNIFRKIRSY